MQSHACHHIEEWMFERELGGKGLGDWGPVAPARRIPAPVRTYSRRSELLAILRSGSEWAESHADEYIRVPTEAARISAEAFINNLADACLGVRLALSQDGEINFFYGEDDSELFQILIDSSGLISYYANVSGEDVGGDDLTPEAFPHLKLLAFVDRNK